MPEIEVLMVANHVEAINGLLYLSGGGWTDLRRPAAPQGGPVPVNHMGIAIAILVGWNDTNQRHRLDVRLENADGRDLVTLQADVEVGRPPGLPVGSDLRTVMGINVEFQFPSAGIYRIVAAVAGNRRSISFRVHDIAGAAVIPGQPPQQQ